MNKNEYFSNSYRTIISNKYLHLILILLENFLTLTAQTILYNTNYNFQNNSDSSNLNFHCLILNLLNSIPLFLSLIIIILFFLIIPIYYFIYNKYLFKQKCLLNIIIINIFELLIFRLLFIILCHIIFLFKGILLFVVILFSFFIYSIIIFNFFNNHLYYFSPHFVIYPFDYYSCYVDIINLMEKILISLSLHSSINSLNEFLFIFVFILQLICFLFSIYIMKFRSFYFMNNIFLNKSRFSLIFSNLIVISIFILAGKKNIKRSSFILYTINVYITFFIIIQIFYNPYNYAYFGTNDNINNLYFYFFIMDHNKNKTFILEEKLEEHYSLCNNCELCYNLKQYLMNKVNYKKMYMILYKDIGTLSRIFNEIIYVLLINGKNSLKNNSYYLISIIYCYYIHYNKKNYSLSSNLKIIYEIINEENSNILENHLISTEQILLINDFLNKADNILDIIQEVVCEKIFKNKVRKFFFLMRILFSLNDTKFKKKLYLNKNEGVINFCRYISLCSMIYEEIFNSTLSNGSISLRENQLFLDELSNKNNNELNQIIIELDILNLENKIIYALGEFAKYKDKNLCKLFPNIFRSKQLLIIKKKILNLKYFLSRENEDDQNNLTNKVIQSQYIDFQFIINDIEENQNKYKIINLRLNLIYPLDISKKLLLAGIYTIEKNIIITLDKSTKEKKKEYIINLNDNKDDIENKYDDSLPSNNNNFIKYKKNEKYYNNQKLIFIDKYFINPNNYNIYYIFSLEKQKTYKENINIHPRNSTKNLFLDDNKIKMDSEGNQNFNILLQSTSASTFTQISNHRDGLKKRNKNGNKNNKKRNYFQYYQIFLFIFSLIIFLCQIICHISINNFNNNFGYRNSILMNFKNYYGIFNILFSSILSLVCLSDESRGENCNSTFGLFEKYYNIKYSNETFNITQYIFYQNKIYSNRANSIKHTIMENLATLNNQELIDLVYSKMPIYFCSQNISQNEVKLILKIENQSFVDVLDYMNNGFLIMSSNYEHLDEKVYIVDKVNLNNLTISPFIHMKINIQLSQYQNYFYYLILNYQSFMQRLDLINLRLIIFISILSSFGLKLSYIFILINLLLYILLIFVLFLYMKSYFKLIAHILDEIDKKMNLRNDNISVEEMFLQKIKKLKIIISLYKQDIYQAIVDLNFIYDNYKKFIEEKNKEMAKYLKKEKYINESNNNNTIEKKAKKMKFQKIINVPENKRYFYYLSAILFFVLILNIGFFIMWITYGSLYLKINSLIKAHSKFSDDCYKIINYYQLMIFHNFTIDDINRFERYNKSLGEDFFSNLYTDIQNLYDSKKLLDKLKKYDLGNIDSYYNFTCPAYYNYLYNNNIMLKNFDNKFKDFLIFVCDNSNIFKSNNYKQIFSILFEYLQIGINEINDHSYDGLIKAKNSLTFAKINTFYLTVYNYALEILGSLVQRKSYQKINSLKVQYTNLIFSLYYVISFILILIIIFVFIWNINLNISKFYVLKKVFKVCNKKD